MNPLLACLDADADALQARWERVQAWIEHQFGREPTIEAILFLVGVQARGRGFEPRLRKEEKQDLIMEGTHCVFEALGVYRRIGRAPDGRGVWERRFPNPPDLSVAQQETLLRTAIVRYFDGVIPGEWQVANDE